MRKRARNPIVHADSVSKNASPEFIFLSFFFLSRELFSTGSVLKHLVHAFSCDYRVMAHAGSLESTHEVRVPVGYRLGELLRFFRAYQTSPVHHNLKV